jgi:UV DNA damage endonuclease
MIRLGLCCIFAREPIRVRAFTAKRLQGLSRDEQLGIISEVCLHNVENLGLAIQTVARLGIGAFRISSPLLPRYTHPDVGYRIADLPAATAINQQLTTAKTTAEHLDIRLSFHPDQFVVLSSPRVEVVTNSLAELAYQAMLAERVGADVINLHGGGAYGNKDEALSRLRKTIETLPEEIRCRLTLENDDTTYTPEDLLPVCHELQIPLVYDVHHHRCNADQLSVEAATEAALSTWQAVGREPHFHLSSPAGGWGSKNPRPHHDYIDPDDFPACWRHLDCTIDVEAKAKELAILQLMEDGQKGGWL